MPMNSKKIISLAIFFSLFCLATSALGVGITGPVGVPTDFSTLLTNIATKVGELVATLGTVMIIVAGIFYLTSAGSPERIGVAKKALIYAIAGIVIGLAASAIGVLIKGIIG